MKRSDTKQYLLNDKDLRTLVWRSLPLEASWHYERQQHLGFAFMMMSALRKIYKDQPDKYRLRSISGKNRLQPACPLCM